MVYFDFAATTPLDSAIKSAMEPYFSQTFGNASSVHAYGRESRMAIERARQQVADTLGAHLKEVVFTSSASESNNLALKGVIESVRAAHGTDRLYEIVASPVEHPCVIETLKHLESLGWVRVVWLPVDAHGMVSAQDVQEHITDTTVLVSVMYVNNEIGTLMPVPEIGRVIVAVKKQRTRTAHSLPLYFHCDGVQAFQYYECGVDALGVDLFSLSSHKVYGPKGVGVLYVRDGVRIVRQIDGGGQEYYMRAGTENVAAIVGAGEAFYRASLLRSEERIRLSSLQKHFISRVLSENTHVQLTGDPDLRAPHIVSFFFENTDSEAFIIALDRAGFAVSSGSACSSGVVRQSHVIQSLGLSPLTLKSGAALRVSFGRTTTAEEVDALSDAIHSAVEHVRSLLVF